MNHSVDFIFSLKANFIFHWMEIKYEMVKITKYFTLSLIFSSLPERFLLEL